MSEQNVSLNENGFPLNALGYVGPLPEELETIDLDPRINERVQAWLDGMEPDGPLVVPIRGQNITYAHNGEKITIYGAGEEADPDAVANVEHVVGANKAFLAEWDAALRERQREQEERAGVPMSDGQVSPANPA